MKILLNYQKKVLPKYIGSIHWGQEQSNTQITSIHQRMNRKKN